MEGTVKFFNKLKGFGFVKGDDEQDYFIHITAIEQGTFLQEGDRVSFDAIEDEKGLKAQNVKKIGSGEATEAPAEEEQPAEEEASEEEAEEEKQEE